MTDPTIYTIASSIAFLVVGALTSEDHGIGRASALTCVAFAAWGFLRLLGWAP